MVRVKITISVTVRENFDLWDWSKSHLQSLWKGRWVSLSIPFNKKKILHWMTKTKWLNLFSLFQMNNWCESISEYFLKEK